MKINWISFSIRLLVALLLIGGTYVLHGYVTESRASYRAANAELEEIPQKILESASRASELSRRRLDLKRIDSLIVSRDQIVDIVTTIETEATKHGVEVSVPEIAESEEATDLEDIVIQISVDGAPSNVIDFAHVIEHLPYLATMKSFSFTTRSSSLPQISFLAPDGNENQPEITAHAEIILIVAVKNIPNETN